MEKWMVAAKKADFDGWARQFGISPVLARIIRNRDITEPWEVERFLHGALSDCYSPWLLRGMEQAVAVIIEEMDRGTRIRVIGDYDVDGICSSYILTRAFRGMGAAVDTAIPHRIRDGYGLNETLIEEAHRDGVGLIVTCDNGIAAQPQIALASELGLRVVVTDHHEVPFVEEEGRRHQQLPQAQAVIDPKQEGCEYPFKSICGAVVAYKLVQALGERTGYSGLGELLEELLPFVAMATVCDVMELRDENRILVREGLGRFATCKNPGLQALVEVNGLDVTAVSAYHLGFVLGPCLNATGRLDTAVRALALLESRDKPEAMRIARELKELNDSRKNMTLQGVEEAVRQVEAAGREPDPVMVLYLPQVHESLAGIIAGRLRERYHHPVFVLTSGEEGVKGSGRSIESYHMFEAMSRVKQYFTKFGGHKMAAGLSMREEDVEPLRRALNADCGLTKEDYVPLVHIDIPMPIAYASVELARELECLQPYGTGNPKPLFAQKGVRLTRAKRIGAKQNYARLTVEAGESRRELMFFGDLEEFCLQLEERHGPDSAERLFGGGSVYGYEMNITYQIGINRYHGREELQMTIQNFYFV
ncbi:MAG: single-stranded-DNA-specific exonuclease RecJ [bacterium]|nr:single-stranded-DNA-specific exonuclease RecJ [bacterium]MCM1376518.1 single-stranded-DNA-specific exonuclease RecJ [Muribaculum sp.]MCM1410830.1 single-stranded-DNA-specific exonuclease RecJ [Lachnospiraceae bacterium]